MSEQQPPRGTDTPTLVAGTVIVLGTIAAWLLAEDRGIETGPLFGMVVPVVSALLIMGRVSAVHDTTRKVERQTNGELTRRLEDHQRAVEQTVAAQLASVVDTLAPRSPAVPLVPVVPVVPAGERIYSSTPEGSSTPN